VDYRLALEAVFIEFMYTGNKLYPFFAVLGTHCKKFVIPLKDKPL
jgi:hypothetical protein